MPPRILNQTPEEAARRADALERVKRYKAKYPERVREQHRKTYAKYREQNLLKKHVYDEANRERQREYTRRYHLEHKAEGVAYQARTRESRREYYSQWSRARSRSDPAWRLRHLLKGRLWKVLHRTSAKKAYSLVALIGCSYTELRKYLESKFTDGMSWDLLGKIQIDHILPCSSFDLTDPEQQKACFHYSNLQPLWASDNQRKSNKWSGNGN